MLLYRSIKVLWWCVWHKLTSCGLPVTLLIMLRSVTFILQCLKCTLYPLHAQTGQSKQFMRHNWMLITKQAVLGPLECKWQDRDFKSNCCWLKCSEQAHFHTKHNTQKGWNGIMSDIQHTDPANNYGRSTEIPMLESQGQDNPFRWHSLLQLLFKIPSSKQLQ